MSKPALQIQFPPLPWEPMHRAMNYIEDVDRIVRDQKLGAVDDIDHYGHGTFVVRVAATRHLGKMLELVSKLLRQHGLETHAAVTRQK